MIQFDCPHCRKTLRVKDEFAGKRGKCPHCQNVADVPAQSIPPCVPAEAPLDASAPTGAVAASAPAAAVQPTPPVPVPAARPVTARGASGLGIAALVLGILGIVFCWFPPLGLSLAFIGLILAAVGLILSTTERKSGVGMPIAGLVVSFVAVITGATMLWVYKSAAEYVFENVQEIRRDVEDTDRAPSP